MTVDVTVNHWAERRRPSVILHGVELLCPSPLPDKYFIQPPVSHPYFKWSESASHSPVNRQSIGTEGGKMN